jgi:lambda family phage tail tape measure protein
MSAAAIGFQTNIQRGLGDNIYKSLNGDFENIGSAWKSLLSRMLADALAANLSSAIFGKNGAGGLLSMFGSLLGSLGGMAGAAGGAGGAGAMRVTSPGPIMFAANGAFGDFEGLTPNSILTKPTLFKFAKGDAFNVGVGGEAGPEAIMPLKRDSAGRLGVSGGGGGVTVNDNRVINIDSRSDRASIMQDIQRANKQSNAELVDLLSRQGKI